MPQMRIHLREIGGKFIVIINYGIFKGRAVLKQEAPEMISIFSKNNANPITHSVRIYQYYLTA